MSDDVIDIVTRPVPHKHAAAIAAIDAELAELEKPEAQLAVALQAVTQPSRSEAMLLGMQVSLQMLRNRLSK